MSMINDKYLNEVCDEVTAREDIEGIIYDMRDIIYRGDRRAVGLAANQIGYKKRIIIINTTSMKEIMINPVIVKRSKETSKQKEGCLSFDKGFTALVNRPKQITVEWISRGGTPKKRKLRGLDARVVQHEVDHLNGITIKDTEFSQDDYYKDCN